MLAQGIIARYRDMLDLPAYSIPVTLHEGDTPLIPVPRLAEELGGGFDLYVKFEGLNPTGSFKDRGMTVAISEALGAGVKAVICASTGNTAASAAAYAARAGQKAVVLIPQGKVATGKLAGAIAYGAQVVQIDGSFDDALNMVVSIANVSRLRWSTLLIRIGWRGKDGRIRDLRCAGACTGHVVPAGGQCRQYHSLLDGIQAVQRIEVHGVTRILGVQASGSAPLVLGHPVDKPETVATAIRIGRPRAPSRRCKPRKIRRQDHCCG